MLCGVQAVAAGLRPMPRSSAVEARPAVADVFVIPTQAGSGSSVLGYKKTGGAPVETITGIAQPRGLTFDAKGRLYVTDGWTHAVLVFPPGSTKPSKTVNLPTSEIPGPVAVGDAGHLWIGNAVQSGGGNLIEVDTNGKVLKTVVCPNLSSYAAVAVDHQGNAFVQGFNATQLAVDEIHHGQTTCGVLSPEFAYPGGLAITNAGDLVVTDENYSHALTYGAPTFSKIVARTMFQARSLYAFPWAISLTRDNTQIWTASRTSSLASVALWNYPRARNPLVTLNISGGAIAIAVNY